MKTKRSLKALTALFLLLLQRALGAPADGTAVPSPEEVFRHPPAEAHAGVWWHWMVREEFRARRGYDCFAYLPILGNFTNGYTAAECARFRADYDRTIRDLYRDVLFRRMSARLRAEGLAFANEPYAGPFDPAEVAPFIDRLMTEFWYRPNAPGGLFSKSHRLFNTFRRADGSRHNVIEAEAFTGDPSNCRWCETPASLKPSGDRAWLDGVNRFILHACPLQPWGDDVKPGVTMGRWGTHFGRNQTWGESGRAWFDYLARAQALLQWGEPCTNRLDVPCAQLARRARPAPAALTSAIAARRTGRTAVVISPETRIGGLTTGGLGQTDIGNKSAFGGARPAVLPGCRDLLPRRGALDAREARRLSARRTVRRLRGHGIDVDVRTARRARDSRGLGAAMSIDDGCPVQDLPYAKLAPALKTAGQVFSR